MISAFETFSHVTYKCNYTENSDHRTHDKWASKFLCRKKRGKRNPIKSTKSRRRDESRDASVRHSKSGAKNMINNIFPPPAFHTTATQETATVQAVPAPRVFPSYVPRLLSLSRVPPFFTGATFPLAWPRQNRPENRPWQYCRAPRAMIYAAAFHIFHCFQVFGSICKIKFVMRGAEAWEAVAYLPYKLGEKRESRRIWPPGQLRCSG